MTIKITNKSPLHLAGAVLLALALLFGSAAQTTALSYQDRLTDNGNPASGRYDFQFKLFDTATIGTGTQVGSTVAAATSTLKHSTSPKSVASSGQAVLNASSDSSGAS